MANKSNKKAYIANDERCTKEHTLPPLTLKNLTGLCNFQNYI